MYALIIASRYVSELDITISMLINLRATRRAYAIRRYPRRNSRKLGGIARLPRQGSELLLRRDPSPASSPRIIPVLSPSLAEGT